jgi:hypothetical protein
MIASSGCSYIKYKVFTPEQNIPRVPFFTIDTTYKLYVRSICRDAARSSALVNGLSVFRNECHLVDTPNVLIERQYLYYSQVHRTAVFIMLLPNYPRWHNGTPKFDLPAIRNKPVVNLWNANCFLFGRMNENGNQIQFKHWDSRLVDDWEVQIDPLGQFIEITGVTERSKKTPNTLLRVADHLAVNVVYRLVSPTYPMNLDGKALGNPKLDSCGMEQRFYYKDKKDGYLLYIPYIACSFPVAPGQGIVFKGTKDRGTRLPYDVRDFFLQN